MKKESAKILGLILLSVLLISLVANFVAAQSIWQTITEKAWGPDAFSITTLTQGTWFAQFLIFLLITLIVYAISEWIPFLEEKSWLSFAISVIIGLLASVYLKSEEVYTILLSYSAFGIVLTSIIPFILIAVIAKKLNEKGHTMMGKVMWIALAVVIIMKWFTATEIGAFGKIAYPIVLILVAVMLIWENRLYLILFKKQVTEFKTQYNEEQIAELRGELDRMGEEIRATTDDNVQNVLIGKYNKKAAKLRKFGVNWKDYGKA
jgi:hypothetical protein